MPQTCLPQQNPQFKKKKLKKKNTRAPELTYFTQSNQTNRVREKKKSVVFHAFTRMYGAN